jgi:hypothetical protein
MKYVVLRVLANTLVLGLWERPCGRPSLKCVTVLIVIFEIVDSSCTSGIFVCVCVCDDLSHMGNWVIGEEI